MSVILLLVFPCGGGDLKEPTYPSDDSLSLPVPPTKATGSGVGTGGGPGGGGLGVQGGGGRGEAYPTEPQYLWDCTQERINPWGPVLYAVPVPTAGGTIMVNRLSSPDPFTATWQLEDGLGTILVTNADITQGLQQVEENPEPPTQMWTGPEGFEVEIYQNEIVV